MARLALQNSRAWKLVYGNLGVMGLLALAVVLGVPVPGCQAPVAGETDGVSQSAIVTPDAGAACGPINCSGCCDGTGVCQFGVVNTECGARGAACVACAAPQTCQQTFPGGVCRGCNCPNGCCDSNNVCQPGNQVTDCGGGGSICATCTSNNAQCIDPVCTNQMCNFSDSPATKVCTATDCEIGPAHCDGQGFCAPTAHEPDGTPCFTDTSQPGKCDLGVCSATTTSSTTTMSTSSSSSHTTSSTTMWTTSTSSSHTTTTTMTTTTTSR